MSEARLNEVRGSVDPLRVSRHPLLKVRHAARHLVGLGIVQVARRHVLAANADLALLKQSRDDEFATRGSDGDPTCPTSSSLLSSLRIATATPAVPHSTHAGTQHTARTHARTANRGAKSIDKRTLALPHGARLALARGQVVASHLVRRLSHRVRLIRKTPEPAPMRTWSVWRCKDTWSK